MDSFASKVLSNLTSSGSPLDVGGLVKGEIEEAISPITERVDRLETKIQLLIQAVERVEKLLKNLQPIASFVTKLPFLK